MGARFGGRCTVTDRARGNILVAIQFVLLAVIVLLPRGSSWIVALPVTVCAWVAVAVGVLAAVLALITLGKSLSANPVPVESGQLKTSGIFALVRHPVYSGIMIGVIGYAVLARSWFVVAGVVAMGVLFAIKARFEEALLIAKYPDYLEYARRVGRFVPGVGRMSSNG